MWEYYVLFGGILIFVVFAPFFVLSLKYIRKGVILVPILILLTLVLFTYAILYYWNIFKDRTIGGILTISFVLMTFAVAYIKALDKKLDTELGILKKDPQVKKLLNHYLSTKYWDKAAKKYGRGKALILYIALFILIVALLFVVSYVLSPEKFTTLELAKIIIVTLIFLLILPIIPQSLVKAPSNSIKKEKPKAN